MSQQKPTPIVIDERTPSSVPPQEQSKHPGLEHEMNPEPMYSAPWYKGSEKLLNKKALITGGDSGIGRSVAILFAREGCDVAITYYQHEGKDAQQTKKLVEKEGRKCVVIKCDLTIRESCFDVVHQTVSQLGGLDIVVNNAAWQQETDDFAKLDPDNLERTFKTNIYSYFYVTQAALPHLKEGSVIINTTSVNAYKGHKTLIDYTATKGAIVAFTYSLSQTLAPKGIRVNGVAPGPIWTPLIPSSFDKEHVKDFGKNVPLGRPGQPEEVSPSFVFLASRDSSYITGQVIHPNGGVVTHS